jgi:2-polyprenyl-3-methyl-5-hydroxy-6-metoxy-1,4-benzoquinol methylase
MPKARGTDDRDFDQTDLNEAQHGKVVHRDYAAHYFRWGWVSRFIHHTHKVVEIGCGKDTPLMRVLARSKSTFPKRYVGVDLNDLSKVGKAKWAKFFGEFNFCRDYKKLPKHNDVIVHLEVIEHMQLKFGRQLLRGCHFLLKKGGIMICSTPVFNGRQANNHIHEYTIEELQKEIEKAGFKVMKRYGTFMNVKEVTKKASTVKQEHKAVFNELGEYYSNDVLSTFLAPLYPDLCRNNIWICKKV